MNHLYWLWVVIPSTVLVLLLLYFGGIIVISEAGKRFPEFTDPEANTSFPAFTAFMLVAMSTLFAWILFNCFFYGA